MEISCAICNQFQGRWPIDTRADRHIHKGQGVRNLILPGIPWSQVLTSSKQCYVCEILVRGCRGVFSQRDIKERDVLQCSIRFYYPYTIDDIEDADCSKCILLHLTKDRVFEIELFATDDDDCLIPDSWDYFTTRDRTSLATDSPKALATIKGWMKDCVENHGDTFCGHMDVTELPKRVVDVGKEGGTVRIIEPKGLKARYICLSHCWGSEQIITTTTSTINDRMKGIVWTELSRTFQDAITLTRRLKFQYIWIDSLCIIQDSVQDWEIESAKMASIYSNGHCTIAATKSRDGRGGLFSSTPDYCVAGQTPDGEAYCIYFRERIDHQIDVAIMDGVDITSVDFPLLSRAWVYQERILSTRVVHFGRNELFFECKCSIQCECGGASSYDAGNEIPAALIKVEYANALSNFDDWVNDGEYGDESLTDIIYHAQRLWRTVVCCYTALGLTKSKDRLPAIGGVAKQMASARRVRYLAGLWDDSMNDDLLWKMSAGSGWKTPRPEPRNAPTWSWASVESRLGVVYSHAIAFTNLEGHSFEDQPPHTHFSRVGNCEVIQSAVDEFGSIKQGTLKISGLCAHGCLVREQVNLNGETKSAHYVSFSDTRFRLHSDYLLDVEGPNYISSGSRLYCLRMSMLRKDQKDCLVSLVLRSSPTLPGCFERIGLLEILGEIGRVDEYGGIFDMADKVTLCIV